MVPSLTVEASLTSSCVTNKTYKMKCILNHLNDEMIWQLFSVYKVINQSTNRCSTCCTLSMLVLFLV